MPSSAGRRPLTSTDRSTKLRFSTARSRLPKSPPSPMPAMPASATPARSNSIRQFMKLPKVTGGATLGSPSSATLTIHDNDSQPTISINDVTINEGNSGTTDFDFTVSLSNPSSQTITVNAQTADDTATTADSDYTGVGSTLLTFSPTITTQHFHVLVNGDTKYELNETFFVNLSGETNATILDGQGLGTITNDDTAPTIAINDRTLNEGTTTTPSPTTPFTFTLTKTGST